MTPAKMPAPKPVTRMPAPDDPDIVAARQMKTQDEFQNRRGRSASLLTGRGGAQPVYSRTTMG